MTRNRSDQIRLAIEDEIASGALVAGTRLDEQSLAERFAVSRTPAREALVQLASLGLVTIEPRRGAVVRGLSTREYVALLEVIAALESLAAQLAARRMPADLRARFERHMAACREAGQRGDIAAYSAANTAFHEAIYDGCLNDVLAAQVRLLRRRAHRLGAERFRQPSRVRNSLAEHERVFAAVMAGDDAAADAAMMEHILTGGAVYTDIIAAMPADARAADSVSTRR